MRFSVPRLSTCAYLYLYYVSEIYFYTFQQFCIIRTNLNYVNFNWVKTQESYFVIDVEVVVVVDVVVWVVVFIAVVLCLVVVVIVVVGIVVVIPENYL